MGWKASTGWAGLWGMSKLRTPENNICSSPEWLLTATGGEREGKGEPRGQDEPRLSYWKEEERKEERRHLQGGVDMWLNN